MKYSKPEVNTLGTACAVIEFVTNKIGSVGDGNHQSPYLDPAYDLDE